VFEFNKATLPVKLCIPIPARAAGPDSIALGDAQLQRH
jgi:hypothetical protein